MLAEELGIRLILWLGKGVPRPASPTLLESLQSIEVTSNDEEGDGFQMKFTMQKENGFEFNALADGSLDSFSRVTIALLLGVTPTVLIDGVVTRQEIDPGSDQRDGTIAVTGKDVSIMLDGEKKRASYPNQTDSIIVQQILAQYAQYGIIPTVTPTTDVPIEVDRIPRQNETDLQFIKRLAQRNGFVFYIEPKTFGVNMAYWGPKIRTGLPQSALTLNMGGATNVQQLSFSLDPLAPIETQGSIVEPITGITLPIPPLPSLQFPPLASSPITPFRKDLTGDTAKLNPATAATSIIASKTNAPDAVQGEGTLDSLRYGNALKARQLVGVRGAGQTYNGLYYVKRVTHTIKLGEYTQSFTISREGTGALLPVVIP